MFKIKLLPNESTARARKHLEAIRSQKENDAAPEEWSLEVVEQILALLDTPEFSDLKNEIEFVREDDLKDGTTKYTRYSVGDLARTFSVGLDPR